MLQELQNYMGRDATQNSMIPGGYGEFGLVAANPISDI